MISIKQEPLATTINLHRPLGRPITAEHDLEGFPCPLPFQRGGFVPVLNFNRMSVPLVSAGLTRVSAGSYQANTLSRRQGRPQAKTSFCPSVYTRLPVPPFRFFPLRSFLPCFVLRSHFFARGRPLIQPVNHSCNGFGGRRD